MSEIDAPTPNAWDVVRTEGEGGTGNWRALRRGLDDLHAAAEIWKQELGAVEKAWLCWNMNDDWCLLQQKLILESGWTPVVGWDPSAPRGGPGNLASGAVAIDFNKYLKFPVMFPHVPMELAFLWTNKLAFWHADMLLPRGKMSKATHLFDNLTDGEIAAVYSFGGLRNIFKINQHRYWEVLGCLTRSASQEMFLQGCGWWRHWGHHHINAPIDESLRAHRAKYYWDHGCGVMYWSRNHRGRVRTIREGFIKEGHFSVTSKRDYRRAPSKSEEMKLNFDLQSIAAQFGISDLL